MSNAKLQQVQEEYNAYREQIKREMIEKQEQYDEECKSLQNQIQSMMMQTVQSESQNVPEETNQLKQQIAFQDQQIQSLKVKGLNETHG